MILQKLWAEIVCTGENHLFFKNNMIWMVFRERYCNASPNKSIQDIFYILLCLYFHSLSNQLIWVQFKALKVVHRYLWILPYQKRVELMYNWSFLFVVLHKPTLLPSTLNSDSINLKTVIFLALKVIQNIWQIREGNTFFQRLYCIKTFNHK